MSIPSELSKLTKAAPILATLMLTLIWVIVLVYWSYQLVISAVISTTRRPYLQTPSWAPDVLLSSRPPPGHQTPSWAPKSSRIPDIPGLQTFSWFWASSGQFSPKVTLLTVVVSAPVPQHCPRVPRKLTAGRTCTVSASSSRSTAPLAAPSRPPCSIGTSTANRWAAEVTVPRSTEVTGWSLLHHTGQRPLRVDCWSLTNSNCTIDQLKPSRFKSDLTFPRTTM